MTHGLDLSRGAQRIINGTTYVMDDETSFGGLRARLVRFDGGLEWISYDQGGVPSVLWRTIPAVGGPKIPADAVGQGTLNFGGYPFERIEGTTDWHRYQAVNLTLQLLLFSQDGRWKGKYGSLITSIS